MMSNVHGNVHWAYKIIYELVVHATMAIPPLLLVFFWGLGDGFFFVCVFFEILYRSIETGQKMANADSGRRFECGAIVGPWQHSVGLDGLPGAGSYSDPERSYWNERVSHIGVSLHKRLDRTDSLLNAFRWLHEDDDGLVAGRRRVRRHTAAARAAAETTVTAHAAIPNQGSILVSHSANNCRRPIRIKAAPKKKKKKFKRCSFAYRLLIN